MPTFTTKYLVKFLALFCYSGILLCLLIPNISTAAFTKQINYQGKLTNSSGSAVSDNTYTFVFNLYTTATGGTALWTETNSVTTSGGLFSVMLGSTTDLSTVNFDQPLYLGLTVGSDAEMTPRKILGAVPSSFQTSRLVGTASSTMVDISNYLTVTGNTTLANATTSGYLTIGNAPTGANFSTGNLNIENNLVIGNQLKTQEICLGIFCRTTWPSASGGAGLWATTSGNSLVMYPDMSDPFAVVIGGFATRTSDSIFEVQGTSTLATTSLAYDSWFGASLGNNSLEINDYSLPTGAFSGSHINLLEGNSDIDGVAVNNSLIVQGIGDTDPSLVLSSDSSNDYVLFSYATTSDIVSIFGTNVSGGLKSLGGLLVRSDALGLSSDNNPYLNFGSFDGSSATAQILYSTSTDTLNFNNASSYYFDTNLNASGYLTIGSAPSGANLTNGNLNVQNNVVIGGNSTTSGYMTIGEAPAGSPFGNGDLNVGDNLIVNGVLLTNAISPGGNSVADWTSPGIFIVGGSENRVVAGANTGIIGGLSNTVSASSVGGGIIIGGGWNNTAGGYIFGSQTSSTTQNGVVIGGLNNVASSTFYSSVLGGRRNSALGDDSSIIAGMDNIIPYGGDFSVIVGGSYGTTTGDFSVMLGGDHNEIKGNHSIILDGSNNLIDTGVTYGYIFGGEHNTVSNSNSYAMGRYMTVSGNRSFGINLSSGNTPYTLSDNNTFAVFGGTTTLATTTMSYGSKIGTASEYIKFGQTTVGSNTFPTISFVSPLGIINDNNTGAIQGNLVLEEENSNPAFYFGSKDGVSSSYLYFATTTSSLLFSNANRYYFDNNVSITDGKSLFVEGDVILEESGTLVASTTFTDNIYYRGNLLNIYGGNTYSANPVDSFLIAGGNNYVQGSNSGVIGGSYNVATGTGSSVIVNSSLSTVNGGTIISSNNSRATSSVGGFLNFILGADGSRASSTERSGIIGGQLNTVLDKDAYIVGGISNTINLEGSIIVGGTYNVSNGGGIYSSDRSTTTNRGAILGGSNNEIAGGSNVIIIGGTENYIDITGGTAAGIFAGNNNRVTGNGSIAMGGNNNVSSGGNAGIYTGHYNTASGDDSAVLAGINNVASGNYSVVLGGTNSTSSGIKSAVLGGESNNVSGSHSLALDGKDNIISGNFSYALGGQTNSVSGSGSYSVGNGLTISGNNVVGISLNTGNTADTYTITGSNLMSIMGGNVGIGTTTPGRSLVVVGDVDIWGGSTLTYRYKGLSMLTASTTLSSVFLGTGVDNFSSSGIYNTGVGIGSLSVNSSGIDNTAVGAFSLIANTTGNGNTAVGAAALNANISGSSNVAIGDSSLLVLASGSYNTAIGNNSGIGSGTIPDQKSLIDERMVFVGWGASRDSNTSSTSALTNGIAIGNNSKVGGSNMMALGGLDADSVNVGISTSTPQYALVVGSGHADEGIKSIQVPYGSICVDNDGYCTPRAGGGDVTAATYRTQNSDLAENYQAFESNLEAGDIVTFSNTNNNDKTQTTDNFGLRKADQVNKMVGVISTKPGMTLGQDKEDPNYVEQLPVALSGRVPVKVNLEGGPITIGDKITLSSVPGVGTKAVSSTETIGIALENYSSSGQGQIMVFVNLGYAHISSNVAQGSININNLWSLDDTNGQIKATASLNLNGFDLTNVRSIAGMGGWSISEGGNLIAKSIKADNIIAENGVTVKDQATGAYNCIYIENGVIKNKTGECVEVGSSQNNSNTDSGGDLTSTTTDNGTNSQVAGTSTENISPSVTPEIPPAPPLVENPVLDIPIVDEIVQTGETPTSANP